MNGMKILLIEDDVQISRLIAKVARENGFQVRMASNENDIRFTYKDFKPNIILLDILMPEMDGFEVLQYLSECRCPAPIIILSGSKYNDIAQNLGNALNLNITANIQKPFRIKALRMMLSEIRFSFGGTEFMHMKN